MDLIQAAADHCIRRALAFAGLAIMLVMVALSFDLPLALRTGAELAACVALVMLVAAWRTDRRDMRYSETWTELRALRPEFTRRLPRHEAQRQLTEVVRRRLLWHAERVGLAAVVLWALTLGTRLARLV